MPIGMVQENEDQNNKEAVQINLTTTNPCTTNATLHNAKQTKKKANWRRKSTTTKFSNTSKRKQRMSHKRTDKNNRLDWEGQHPSSLLVSPIDYTKICSKY